MPAVIAAEYHLIATCRCPGNTDCHQVGFAPSLAEAHHFRTGDDLTQQFGSFNFLRMVDTQPRSLGSLFLDCPNHTGEGMSKKQGSRSHVKVNILISINIPEVPIHLPITVNRGDSEGVKFRAASKEVRL